MTQERSKPRPGAPLKTDFRPWYIPNGFVGYAKGGKIWLEPSAKKDYPAQFLQNGKGSITLMTIIPPWSDTHHVFDTVTLTRYWPISSFRPHGVTPVRQKVKANGAGDRKR